MAQRTDVTRILKDVQSGDAESVDRLFPIVYDELRRLSQSYLVSERPGHTLQATALVHEAYLRLINIEGMDWRSRAHFFSVTARAIRRVLIDHARGRNREKRGAGAPHVSLNDALDVGDDPEVERLLSLDEALEILQREYPVQARVVEMRFFGGLSYEEAAEVLGVSTRTVERYWRLGRAWLYRELGPHAA